MLRGKMGITSLRPHPLTCDSHSRVDFGELWGPTPRGYRPDWCCVPPMRWCYGALVLTECVDTNQSQPEIERERQKGEGGDVGEVAKGGRKRSWWAPLTNKVKVWLIESTTLKLLKPQLCERASRFARGRQYSIRLTHRTHLSNLSSSLPTSVPAGWHARQCTSILAAIKAACNK